MKNQNSTGAENPLKEGFTDGTCLSMHINQRLSRLLLNQLETLIKDNSSLNLVSWRALLCLSQLGGSPQKAMIDFARVDQAQMSRALTSLEKSGYVQSAQSSSDRRSRVFTITQTGESYRKLLSPKIDAFHQSITTALTPEENALYQKLSLKIAHAAAQN
jgi:DNA-binding MarR family transcriptional regulator